MPNAPDVTITLNGQSQTLAAPLTVHDLLQHLGMADRRVAVRVWVWPLRVMVTSGAFGMTFPLWSI